MTDHPPQNWGDIDAAHVDRKSTASWIAVLPLAATEQHGPHLPFETDTMIAQAYLTRVHALLPKDIPATFFPIEEIGISTEHMAFSGSKTLTTNDALKRWLELGEQAARIGIRKIVIVTSHGGNSAAMTLIAQDLRARGMLAVTTGWSRFGIPEGLFPADELRFGIHGGAVETSIMLAAYPQAVTKDHIANFESAARIMKDEFRWLSDSRPAAFAWAAQDLNPRGAIGDATLATVDKGRALIEHGARAFCELLQDVHRFDLGRLENKPILR